MSSPSLCILEELLIFLVCLAFYLLGWSGVSKLLTCGNGPWKSLYTFYIVDKILGIFFLMFIKDIGLLFPYDIFGFSITFLPLQFSGRIWVEWFDLFFKCLMEFTSEAFYACEGL